MKEILTAERVAEIRDYVRSSTIEDVLALCDSLELLRQQRDAAIWMWADEWGISFAEALSDVRGNAQTSGVRKMMQSSDIEQLRSDLASMTKERALLQIIDEAASSQLPAWIRCRLDAHFGRCSRCRLPIPEFAPPRGGMTAGYYVATAWEKYANPDEVFICDACMWADARYIADYGAVASRPPELSHE